MTEGKEKKEKKRAKYSFVTVRNLVRLLLFLFPMAWQHSLNASLKQMISVFAKTSLTNSQDSVRSGIYKHATTVLGHLGCLRAVVKNNKAGYTAQDAPSMRIFHLRKKRGTDGLTDTTSYRDATARARL